MNKLTSCVLLHATPQQLASYCNQQIEYSNIYSISYFGDNSSDIINDISVHYLSVSRLEQGFFPDWWLTSPVTRNDLHLMRDTEWMYMSEAQRVNRTIFDVPDKEYAAICQNEAFNPWQYHNTPQSIYDAQTSYVKDISRYKWLLGQNVAKLIFTHPPHFKHGAILCNLAAYMGISVEIHLTSPIPSDVIPTQGFPINISNYTFEAQKIITKPLREETQKEYDRVLGKKYDLPEYEKRNNQLASRLTLKNKLAAQFRLKRPFERNLTSQLFSVQYWYWLLNKNNAYHTRKQFYEQHATTLNHETGNFILLALHWQPEETTTRGGYFHNQYLVAQTLAFALPEGWTLLVKEHPQHFNKDSTSRSIFFYKSLLELPRTKFLRLNDSQDLVMEKCEIFASVTGTILLEAVAKNKVAIAFGPTIVTKHPFCMCAMTNQLTAASIIERLYLVNETTQDENLCKELHNKFFVFLDEISLSREDILSHKP
jgi:hypothetical protein